ncbi:GntR family transcriptional regulator [Streptomyces sp. ME109]|uniref:GntR family transcriptional regulator n=1 Tax=Streptomyces sp. me109 TaxID=1827853 RepID=UPI0021C6CBE1|nr:GntR family transcriptional regulator [Streptomyces sp. me109]
MDEGQSTEGGGKEFWRVLEELRARLANGAYPLGSSLPAQRTLADELGVSRDTVQRALRALAGEGWIESRQGSGSRVVKSPTQLGTQQQEVPRVRATLGTFVARAFAQPVVQLDVFTLTSESLDAHIRLQAERVRLGEVRPERIELRMLLPDTSLTLPYPRAKQLVSEGEARPDDGAGSEPGHRHGQVAQLNGTLHDRLNDITRRHSISLRSALRDLKTEKLVPSVRVEVRYVPLTPAFKLYLRPGVEALFGPYEVVERSILMDDETEVDAIDVLGLGSTLTRHVNDEGDPDSSGSVFVESMRAWFDSCWNLLARPS